MKRKLQFCETLSLRVPRGTKAALKKLYGRRAGIVLRAMIEKVTGAYNDKSER